MNKSLSIKMAFVATSLCLVAFSPLAQPHGSDHSNTPVKDDTAMDHSEMKHEVQDETASAQELDHSNMQHGKDDMPLDHRTMMHDTKEDAEPMQGMDHSKMTSAQSDSPPADARDPHAYSDGLTLDSGDYALPGPRQLVMADEHAFWAVVFDRFEYADGLSSGLENATQYDMQAWYGSSYDRLVIKSEGEIVNNKLEGSENQLLWGHAITPFWDTHVGVRFDTSEGPSRQWLVFGVQGLAPYWFEVDASLSLGTKSRTAFNLEAEYELLITQRLVLQPRVIVSAYGKDDTLNGVGKGLSSVTAGLRLRYEFSRQFAPYLGVEWTSQYGNTAEFNKLANRPSKQTQWVAGIRFWF